MEIGQPISTGTVGNDANVATSLTINPLTSTMEPTAILPSEGAPGQHSVRADNWIWTETDWEELSDEDLQKWFDGLPSLKNVIPDDVYPTGWQWRHKLAYVTVERGDDMVDKHLARGCRRFLAESSRPDYKSIFEQAALWDLAIRDRLPGFVDMQGRKDRAWVGKWGRRWALAFTGLLSEIVGKTLDPAYGEEGAKLQVLIAPIADLYLYIASHHHLDRCAGVLRQATQLRVYNPNYPLPSLHIKAEHLVHLLQVGGQTRHRLRVANTDIRQHQQLGPSDIALSYNDIATIHLGWMDSVIHHIGRQTRFPVSTPHYALPRVADNTHDRRRLEASDRRHERLAQRRLNRGDRRTQQCKDEQARIVLNVAVLAVELALHMVNELVLHPSARPEEVTNIKSADQRGSISKRGRVVSRSSLPRTRDGGSNGDNLDANLSFAERPAPGDGSKPLDLGSRVGEAARRWESAVERALVQLLQHADRYVGDAIEGLTCHIKVIDWEGLRTYCGVRSTGTHRPRAPRKALPVGHIIEGMSDNLQILSEIDEDIHYMGANVRGLGFSGENDGNEGAGDKDDGNDSDDSDDTDDYDPNARHRPASPAGSESDLSHPCPLRDILSLLSMYETYRLGVYDAIVDADPKGGVGYSEADFLRGVDGKLGEAIDRFGLKLMDKFNQDELAAYGLSKHMYEEWHELAERRKGLQRGKRLRDGDDAWARQGIAGFGK